MTEEGAPAYKGGKKSTFLTILPCWILFIVLAAVLAGLRFYNDGQYMGAHRDNIILGGMIALGLLHLYVSIKGFSDSLPTGFLCLFVPGYSIYFLFFESDMFWWRAIGGAILVAFGYDTGLFLMDAWRDFSEAGTSWIGGKREGK